MRTPLLIAGLLLSTPALAACGTESTDGGGGGGGDDVRALTVESSDDACELSASEAPAGTLTFDVANTGSQVTEFYLLGEDGLRIVAEVENIGPALNRELTVNAPAGSYVTACKPGMKGEGIRADFTVTDSDEEPVVDADDQALVDQAVANYASYVEDQSAQLLEKTAEFVGLYQAGDDDAARELYADARTHWERIETVAESFGDLDPMMDAREADLEPGAEFTGWHRIEKDLWPARAKEYQALSNKERVVYADDLLANTETLDGRIQELEFSIDAIADGSRGLLEEVATGKVTGEEEYWSRTDLWDFQANLDGSRKGFDLLEPVIAGRDAKLADKIEYQFGAVQGLLDATKKGDEFVTYDKLTKKQVKAMSDAVNALGESMAEVSAVL